MPRCPNGTRKNRKTLRCEPKKPKTPKTPKKKRSMRPCKSGTYRNPKTNRCKKMGMDLNNITRLLQISPTKKSKEPSYIQSVYKVLFADITISFDNVIGVVGASKGYFEFMIFGLVLSVILTGALATYLANYIQKHLWIAYVGLGFILVVALQLIISGLADLEILKINQQFLKYF